MKQFLQVLKFELSTMLRKKSFFVSTIIVVAVAFIVLSIPRFSSMFNDTSSSNDSDMVIEIYDKGNVLQNKEIVKANFPTHKIKYASSLDSLQKNIRNEKTDAGFEVVSDTNFVYYVNNSSMYDANTQIFETVLSTQYQETQLSAKGYDIAEVSAIYQAPIKVDTQILGKDGMSNYFYTYLLIMLLYMMIIIYGNQIAVGVASEKSNRAIEILTTSCSSNALIFGKVIAGAITGVVQMSLMIGSFLVSYQLNADAWGNMLDKYFDIPVEVLVTFAVFGILGYLLYSFLYGAIGALVSKTEEVNSATMPIQLMIVLCFFVAFMTLQSPDSLISQIAAYFPFTSWICMFIKVAMGSATIMEIGISAILLLITTIAMGFFGAKLYRRGTLSYGNTVKLKNIIKFVKQKD